MNLKELKLKLKEIGVKESEYSINQGLKENAIIVEDLGGFWKVFHYEKGHKEFVGIFKSEAEAFMGLLNSFKDDLKLLGKKTFD